MLQKTWIWTEKEGTGRTGSLGRIYLKGLVIQYDSREFWSPMKLLLLHLKCSEWMRQKGQSLNWFVIRMYFKSYLLLYMVYFPSDYTSPNWTEVNRNIKSFPSWSKEDSKFQQSLLGLLLDFSLLLKWWVSLDLKLPGPKVISGSTSQWDDPKHALSGLGSFNYM